MAFLDFFRRLAAESGATAGGDAYSNLYGGTDAYKPNLPQGRGVGVSMGMNLPQGLEAPRQSADPGPDTSMDQAVQSVGENVRSGLLARSIKGIGPRDTQRDVKDVPSISKVMQDKLGIDPYAVTPPDMNQQLQDAFRILFRRK